jgi:heavy metal sensor kinase
MASILRTLSFRLTLWYGVAFTVSFGLAFLFLYLLISTQLRQRLDDRLSDKISELEAIYNLQGLEEVKAAARIESQAAGEKKVFFRLLYASGVAFSSSNMSYWRQIGINRNAVDQLVEDRSRAYETVVIAHRSERVRIAYGIIGSGIVAQVGYSMEGDAAFISIFKKIFLITMSALIITAVLVGWFMARRALSGVEAVTRTAQQISESDLSRRVPVLARNDEIDRLALTFNQMLDRIENLVADIREMSDNIAHDLKSPLTRIRGIAEMSFSESPGHRGDETLAGRVIEECDRLLDMINTMLIISKTDAGVDSTDVAVVDMAGVVRDAAMLFAPLAEDKRIVLTCEAEDALMVSGNLRMLQRAVSNLVDNAIKYTPEQGRVDIRGWKDLKNNEMITLSIADSGPGIQREDLSKIFNRFYRCDQSRTTEGAGLGLSLSRAIARAGGGEIIAASIPGEGSVFTLTLPRYIPNHLGH